MGRDSKRLCTCDAEAGCGSSDGTCEICRKIEPKDPAPLPPREGSFTVMLKDRTTVAAYFDGADFREGRWVIPHEEIIDWKAPGAKWRESPTEGGERSTGTPGIAKRAFDVVGAIIIVLIIREVPIAIDRENTWREGIDQQQEARYEARN